MNYSSRQLRTIGNRAGRLAVAIGVFMAVFHVATESRQRGAIERPTRSEVASSGKQIVAVLMVSPDCPRSEAEEWRVSWRGLTSRLEARAEPMHKVAVSVDIDPKRASQFLKILGEFDEYTVGGGWNSSGVLWFGTASWRDRS